MGAPSPLALVRAKLAAGERQAAQKDLAALIADAFGLDVASVAVRRDGYSLNSVNGVARLRDGDGYFFKFHHEEGEDQTVAEYYRAELLESAGFPVDRPAHVCREVGRQILLYKLRREPRFADVCKAAEAQGDPARLAALARAQEDLDARVLACTLDGLHQAARADYAAEPILQLFTWRLVDRPGDDAIGGRVARYYGGRVLRLPGLEAPFGDLEKLMWRINGVDYDTTIKELFSDALARLRPEAIKSYPAVVAHGDAHNANVWCDPAGLTWFDPAFAGAHVHALMAEIKATFHNIFAHPLWLYHPGEAEGRYKVSARLEDGRVAVDADWALGPLREAFLGSKTTRYWRPLLAELAARGWLPADWRAFMRRALFCCPTLVMNLSAGEGMGAAVHTAKTSALGWAIAVMCGAEPQNGADPASRFFDAIDPAR